MNIHQEAEAKKFYLGSSIEGMHYHKTNEIRINFLDMLKLMVGFAEKQKELGVGCLNEIKFQQGVVKQEISFISCDHINTYMDNEGFDTCEDCGLQLPI